LGQDTRNLLKEEIMALTPIIRRCARLAGQAAAFLTALALVGCSGGSSSIETSTPSGSTQGKVIVALTDADGDFLSYIVDVESITLHRAGGGTVETLPATTRIDFAELTELSEIFSAATLAPGNIDGGTIRLNYADAEISVERGGDIVAATAVDEDGNPLGVIDLEIRLDSREQLIVTAGRTAFLTIDFDLAASHEVDLSVTPARVTTRPYLVAEVQPITEKELRVRGALVDVDVAASSYEIRLRPWHKRDGDHGAFTVKTTPTTSFEIGDASYTGTPGLDALDKLPAGMHTVAFGVLDLTERTFTAEIVHAGDSVGGDKFAAVHGHVVARTSDTLTIRGGIAVYRDRPAHFRRTITVNVGPDTGVSKARHPDAVVDIGDVSVGQRVVVLGQFTNPEVASIDSLTPREIPLVLDATAGRVRMLVTRLTGIVTEINPGQMDMRLRAIGHLGVDMFDFTGTGITGASDADPLDYEIATRTLSLSALAVDKPARVLGFVAPFGEAPPDFLASTVIDHGALPATLGIGWGEEGTSAPFLTLGPNGLVLDLSNPNIGVRHHLLVGGHVIDLLTLPASPSIVPTDRRGLYGLWQNGEIRLFRTFAEFVTELSLRLSSGNEAHALAAVGAYDDATNTLSATHVAVHLSSAAD
jgi:hypothetical protein